MKVVAYPFPVKHRGIEYAPNAEIEVSEQDFENCIAQGAVEIDRTPVTPISKTKTRKKG